jgi:gliding motility-associated-like protein
MPNGNNYQTFCSSQNPTISYLTPNSSSIKWYESATATNQLNNTTPLLNGQTYFASKQIGSCPESQRLAVTVTITQTPAAPISTNQIFCENINATISNLIATGQNIKWYSSLTDTNSLPTNTLLQNNTNYYATQTVNGCESNKTLINVTINSVPLPSVTSPQTFCVQQNAEINSIVISGQNIKWYDAVIGGNLLSNTSSLTNGQTYYASQTINNCESLRTPVSINIQNTPPPTGTTIQNFCSTQNPTLNDIVTNGTNLNWYNSNSNSSTTVIPSTTPLLNGSTYYATQTINYCESVNRLAVTVNLISTLNANDYTETICDNLNDGSEIINLSSYNTNLISNTTNCTFEYYSSNTGAINQTNTDLIPTVSNYNLTTGDHTFFVRITSSNGCHQIVKLNFSLVNKPVISINDIVPICENKNITINAGSGFNSYSWSTGSTLQSITVTTAGNYSVTVTKNYGTTICSTTKNFTVVLSNVAKITNIETQDWTDNENIITVNTSSNSYGNYEFSINGFNYQDSNVFTGLISGSYTVYVRDKNGCGVTEDEIFLLMYPKFFTPNSDGYNDTWSIKFSYIEPRLKVNIFDRYGKLLKILNNTNSWDGKYNEYELPSDDYWFIVTREDGKEYRGHFTLKR